MILAELSKVLDLSNVPPYVQYEDDGVTLKYKKDINDNYIYQDSKRFFVIASSPVMKERFYSILAMTARSISSLRIPDIEGRTMYLNPKLIQLSESIVNNDAEIYRIAGIAAKTILTFGIIDCSRSSPYFVNEIFNPDLIPDEILILFINQIINNPILLAQI